MRCIIIEDEQDAVSHLEYLLKQIQPDLEIQAKLDAVKTAVQWLQHNKTDLIFLDIQLGDGLSFEIFDQVQVNTPVIFTTSYNQYAIKAFNLNSIAYLLKPINADDLRVALNKYHTLFENRELHNRIIPLLQQEHQKRFLVQTSNTIKSIPSESIAYFHVQNKFLVLVTKDNQQHIFDSTLDSLEKRLDPERFYRINRQFIINIDAIGKMHQYTRGRVKIETTPECKEEMIVSIDKAAEFKNWLNK